jgi:hypothetical protein
MKSTIEPSAEKLQELEKWAEPSWTKAMGELGQGMEEQARESKALVRERKVKGAMILLRLVLAYAVADWSLRLVGIWATIQEIANVSDVALLYRFCRCGSWLGMLIVRVLQQRNQSLSQLGGVRVRLIDATVISKPGSRGTDYRAHLSLDLGKMCINGVELTDAHSGETLARFSMQANEIWVGDQGYATAKGLGAILARAGRLVIRTNWQNLRLLNELGQRLKVLEWIQTLSGISTCRVVVPTPQGNFPMRLIACPLSPDEAEQARQRVTKRAHKDGKRPNPNTLLAAGCILLLTNLPAETWEPARILWLYRLRWQIELQFKRLKSLLHFDHLRAQEPRLVQTYLLAKLLAALLLDRLVQQAEEQNQPLFQSLQRPVSLWRLDALLWLGIRDLVVGPLSLTRIFAALPSLQRYLCDSPRSRTQQLAWARRILARLSDV